MITNADMSLQSGNVVLITRRAAEIYKQFNLRTTCMILNNPSINIKNQSHAWIEYKIISSREAIKQNILTYKPRIIILYGPASHLHIKYIKNILKISPEKPKLILDIQGALEERIEFSKSTKRYIKYLIQRIVLSRAINSTDGAFVVTDELAEYCGKFLRQDHKAKFEIYKVRCGINEVIMTQQKLEWRKTIREQWGISDKTIVMAYSGYRTPWQKVDTIIEEFKHYDEQFEDVFFAFFCNYDEAFEHEIASTFPKGNYVIDFLSFDDYFKYLSGCDVGFLIRDYKVTNRVAFPNKFSDYLNAGLMVAINPALPEPFRILRESGIDFIDVEQNDKEGDYRKMLRRQNYLLEYYHSSESICQSELLYSSQIKNLNI